MTDAERWIDLRAVAKRVGTEFPDAVFIGGLAVFAHSERLGSGWQDGSHDVDFYLSLNDRAAMRDRYDMLPSRRRHKDFVCIENEDFGVYTEHKHNLAIPYDLVASHSLMANGFRVASLEHLMVLKADAALSRSDSDKGQKDLRDLARILTLLTEPQAELIAPYLTPERQEILQRVADRPDFLVMMGLKAHELGRYRQQFTETVKSSSPAATRGTTVYAPLEADQEIPAARVLFGGERDHVLALPEVGTVPELCRRAEIRCRVTGGPEMGVVLWDGPGHGITYSMDYRKVYAIEKGMLPPNDPERSLRILEVLAFGCFDYVARESLCGRGYFIFSGRKWSEERLKREGHGL